MKQQILCCPSDFLLQIRNARNEILNLGMINNSKVMIFIGKDTKNRPIKNLMEGIRIQKVCSVNMDQRYLVIVRYKTHKVKVK